MVSVAQIRSRLESALFSKYGKTVTLRTRGTPTYNDRGDLAIDDITTSSITAVPFDINESRKTYQAFSNYNEGDLSMVVPYTVTISKDDEVTIEGITYQVMEVVKHYLPDNVVTLVRLAKLVT